jgi:hypothetical protein
MAGVLEAAARDGAWIRVVALSAWKPARPRSSGVGVIGQGLPLDEPGSVKGVQLVVEDVDGVRETLTARERASFAPAC